MKTLTRELGIVYLINMSISIFCFFNTEIYIRRGYDLSVDGVVIARAIFIVFAVHNFGKFLEKIFEYID